MTDRAASLVHQLQSRIQQLEAQLADCQTQNQRLVASEATFRAIAEQAKGTEAALARSEAKFRLIVENANDLIVTVSDEGILTYVSPNVVNILGYRPDEMEGQYFAPFMHPDDVFGCHETLQAMVINNQGYDGYENRMRHRDGSHRWFLSNLSVSKDEDGNFLLVSVARDITERKLVEEALRTSDAKLNRILDRTAACIADLRIYPDRRFVGEYFSSGSLQLWGFTPEEMVADLQPWISRHDPVDLEIIFSEVFGYIFNEHPYKLEYRYHHPDGNLRWIQLNMTSYRDETENCWCATAISIDITDRKRIEEALRTSEARLNRILDRTSACIGDYRNYSDRSFVPEYFSLGSYALWGFTPEELLTDINLWVSRMEPEDLQQIFEEAFDYIFNEHPYQYEYRYHHPDGSLRWIQLNMTSYRDSEEDFWRTTVISTDITDRKHAEEAVKQQQEFLRTVLDTNPNMIFVKDWEGKFLLVNKAGAENYGKTVDEFIGKCDRDFYPDEKATNEWLAENRRIIETGEEIFIPEEKLILNGQEEWYQWQKRPLRLPGSSSYSVLGIGVNVTERKRLEEELRQSEYKFRAIVENANDLIYVIDQRGRIVYMSPNSAVINGFSAEEMEGGTFDQFIHPDDLAMGAEAIQRAIAGEKFSFELRSFHKDGSIRWFSSNIAPFRMANGEVGLMGIGRDTTDRKRLEEELRQSQQFLNRVIEILPVGFFAKDVRNDYRYVFVNRCAEPVVGFNPEQGIGFNDHELQFPEALADRWRREDESVVNQQVMVENPGYELVLPTGKHLIIRSLKFPLVNDQGNVTHLLCLTEDITERKQREEELRLAKDAAEAANRAKSTFLANMSHELRTPLNVILGFTQLMERENALSDRQRNFITTINRSGEHLLNLINDVLEMSKIEAGRITLNPEPFDLRHLLDTLQEMFRIRAEAKRLAITFYLPPALPSTVIADEGKLRQVLINLLSNAVKFTERGSISLSVSLEDDEDTDFQATLSAEQLLLHFTVTDTGIGIAPNEIDQLFQPFVQTASGLQVKEGTGLGLTISRQFVQLMGGDIQLQSQPGQGSTFTFQIPVTLTQVAITHPPTRQRPVLGIAPNQSTYRLLIVDDRIDNCNLLTHLLQSFGFETRTANNGQEAIAQWQTWHPHLIWMDMRMPVMDGYEATRQIRALERSQTSEVSEDLRGLSPPPCVTKIIALTASAFEEQRTTILAAGCDDFVRKPFREQLLFDKLTEHLGVQFIYAEPVKDDISSDNSEEQFPTLKVMPLEWIENLRQAAIEIDDDRLMQLVAEIPPQYAKLAEQLSNLVKRFNFDEILERIAGEMDEQR